MSYRVFDLETTIKQSYKRKANPFDPENWVVALGLKDYGGQSSCIYYPEKGLYQFPPIPDNIVMLVGFNIKFDLLWTYAHMQLYQFLKRGGRIWCCQYAEYLLEGQQPHAQMCSMDDIVLKYGGELKDNEVTALWRAGVCTKDIPEDLLINYLHGDINNTEKIFLGQVAAARRQGQYIDILQRMEGLLGTTEMEYNGLFVNKQQAEADRQVLVDELAVIDKELAAALPELPPEMEFNWGSPIQKSCLIFGGSVKYQRWVQHTDYDGKPLFARKKITCLLFDGGRRIPEEQVSSLTEEQQLAFYERADRYASGKKKGEIKTVQVEVEDTTRPKGAKKDFIFTFPGYTAGRDEWKGKLEDAAGGPVYSVGSDIIEELGGCGIPFLQALANREKISKDLGTYYYTEDDNGVKTGMLTCVDEDSIIHHKLNHHITVTTRLSSSDPNLQNVPRADFDAALGRQKSLVKQMFCSRFENGSMLEVDYSQLEVVVQGLLSADPQLVADIIAGVDFHCKRLAAKLKEDYAEVKRKCKDEDHPEHKKYKQMRTGIKAFTFQRAYGAGPGKIAASTGMSIDEVKELIDVEEQLYPGIKAFYDLVEKSCNTTRWPTMIREPLPDKPSVYVQCGRGEYKTITQARFVFTETPLPAFARKNGGKDTGFYRPAIQNWPVQGVGGQLVQYVLGKLFRLFIEKDNWGGRALLVNTVHDCVWIDCENDVLQDVVNHVVPVMQSIPAILKEMFDIDCPVPFPVEAEAGPNMLSLHHVSVTNQ